MLARLGLSADLQVHGGLEEARVAVFLHQAVDFGLGQLETGLFGMLHVLLCDGFGQVVKIYLQGNQRGGEVIISFTERQEKPAECHLKLSALAI